MAGLYIRVAFEYELRYAMRTLPGYLAGQRGMFLQLQPRAGRIMSRTAAKKRVSIEEHIAAPEGMECHKDQSVIDEPPATYNPIEQVMQVQSDLLEIIHTLKQVVCVKG